MKFEKALRYYKTTTKMRVAAGGMTRSAIHKWRQTGIVPELTARRLVEDSGGKLKLEPEDYVQAKVP